MQTYPPTCGKQVSSSATQLSTCASFGSHRNTSTAAKVAFTPQTMCGESCIGQGDARKLLSICTLCLKEGWREQKSIAKSRWALLLSYWKPFKNQKASLFQYIVFTPAPSIHKEGSKFYVKVITPWPNLASSGRICLFLVMDYAWLVHLRSWGILIQQCLNCITS